MEAKLSRRPGAIPGAASRGTGGANQGGEGATAMAAGTGREDPPTRALSLAAEAFRLLASPLRLHIVLALTGREIDVSQLALRVGATPQAVSQHLAKLKLAGAVRVRSEGRYHVYAATDPTLGAVARMMLEKATPELAAGTCLPC